MCSIPKSKLTKFGKGTICYYQISKSNMGKICRGGGQLMSDLMVLHPMYYGITVSNKKIQDKPQDRLRAA